MKSIHALCATALLSAAFTVIGSDLADATEFAVLRQRFDQNGITFNSQSGGVATPVENLDVLLNTMQAGVVQLVSSSLGIVNPDSNGLGTAANFDVFYTGAAADFPASSFFDIFVDLTEPGSNERGRAVIRNIDNTGGGGVSVDINTQFLGSSTPYLNSFVGQINPAQAGLSFSSLKVVLGNSPDPNANSLFDAITKLQFNGPGTINPNVPLFEFTMTAATPEPSTIVLAAMGLAALVAAARRRIRR